MDSYPSALPAACPDRRVAALAIENMKASAVDRG